VVEYLRVFHHVGFFFRRWWRGTAATTSDRLCEGRSYNIVLSRERQEAAAVGDSDGCGQRHSSDEVLHQWKNGETSQSIPAGRRLLRVLVADDNRDAADSLAMLVELWGHDARSAYDGASALEIAFGYRPDLMLLDIAMPKMHGCQLARLLRRQARFKDTLLVAMTGWTDDAHRLLCAEAGFDHYLIKPVEYSVVEQFLRQQYRLVESREALS